MLAEAFYECLQHVKNLTEHLVLIYYCFEMKTTIYPS